MRNMGTTEPPEVFERLRGSGCPPIVACRAASELGLSKLEKLVGLRQAYGLSLIEAKDVLLQESGVARNVDENQAEIAKWFLNASRDELRELLGDES